MSMVSLRLNNTEEELFRSYAMLQGESLSTLFKKALSEKIEDELDYEIGIEALAEHEKNPVTYTADEIIEELANEL